MKISRTYMVRSTSMRLHTQKKYPMPDPHIYTSTYASPIGELSISFTDDVILAIKFADESLPVEEVNNKPVLEQCRAQLDAYFSGQSQAFDFPMSQPGSE